MAAKFSRQHYIIIAASFKASMPEPTGFRAESWAEHSGWKDALVKVCDSFKADNPRFDVDKFIKAITG
jgi:hypothetical protein